MITREEIDHKAREFDIETTHVQRDYVFGWFLVAIFSDADLADVLFLKGGNALRKGYFEKTRYSSDLDFGTERDIDPDFLEKKIQAACDFVTKHAGITFETDRSRIQEKFRAGGPAQRWQVYEVRVYFKDFYGRADHIRIKIQLDITRFDKLFLPPERRLLIHPYSDLESTRVTITCAKLEEVLATKLKCLLQRQHAPDLFDYVYRLFVDREIEVNRAEIARIFLRRTIFERDPGVLRGLFLGLPLDALRDRWGAAAPSLSRLPFLQAVEHFQAGVEELFGSYPEPHPSHAKLFFPAELRNPIMAAGRKQTLLRLTYNGYVRDVEPYALFYKQASGRPAREYFYGFDRTGGSSGRASIKSFVAAGIDGIEETATRFEPRFEIELAKAGEPASRSFFGRRFSGRRGSARTRKRGTARGMTSSRGSKYVVECLFCGRRFTRETNSLRMRKHKDRYGNPCSGRRAQHVTTLMS